MASYKRAIDRHYSRPNLTSNILAALEKAGKRLDSLTREDIYTFDEFHIRGREATRELARLAGLQKNMRVLDLGCGIGGPARTLAAEYGCRVVGVDLVEAYCRAAEFLTEKVGLGDRVEFRRGDAARLPFEDRMFDVVWLQHTSMNIEDKAGMFGEARRVLKNGGRIALNEVCAGAVSPPHFPVPWAGDPSINFLSSSDQMLQMLGGAGFEAEVWQDVSRLCLEWFKNMLAKTAVRFKGASPPLGLGLLMGKTNPEKAKNVLRNLEEDRIRVVQGVLKKGDLSI